MKRGTLFVLLLSLILFCGYKEVKAEELSQDKEVSTGEALGSMSNEAGNMGATEKAQRSPINDASINKYDASELKIGDLRVLYSFPEPVTKFIWGLDSKSFIYGAPQASYDPVINNCNIIKVIVNDKNIEWKEVKQDEINSSMYQQENAPNVSLFQSKGNKDNDARNEFRNDKQLDVPFSGFDNSAYCDTFSWMGWGLLW